MPGVIHWSASTQQPRDRAFTLMEVLLAVAIVSIILTAVMATMVNTMKKKRIVEAESRAGLIGPKILDIIRRDLEACFVYQLDALLDEEEDGEETEGASGISHQEVNYFRGKSDGDGEEARDRLLFVTSRDSVLRVGTHQADICEVGYYLDEGDETYEGCYVLYRREDYHIDRDPVDGGSAIKVYDRMRALSFRYFRRPENEGEQEDLTNGNTDPEDEWDNTAEDEMPLAVEVEIWIDVTLDIESVDLSNRDIRRYRTIVLLPNYPTREELEGEEEEEESTSGE